ncbi:MAG: rhamnulokinase [Bacteroidetes bacterium]|nr:rhamnulokinase [Bacteroidota bacterium]
MNTEKNFIAFDLGAESGRCIVATVRDQRVRLKEVHRFTTHSVRYEKGFYWDILGIYQEILEGLVQAGNAFGPNFDGIGVDTWGVDYVLVDPNGRIIGYPYHYRDDRTDSIMDDAFRIVSKESIYGRVGVQFAQFNTLFQLLSEKKRKSNFLTLADKMLLMPDFINYMLSGKMSAEFSIASTTGLADPIQRDWAWDLIDRFQLPRSLFPEMVEPGTVLGALLPELARKTGLSPGTPVIATAGHDTASAVVSVPADRKSNWAFLSSGTWSLMGIELSRPILTSRAMQSNFTNEGGVVGTTRFLKNIIGLWPLQECRKYWSERSEEYSYSTLTDLAEREGLVSAWVDLNDSRFLKPGDMPEKILAFLKESKQTTKSNVGFIVDVILESLAFSYRRTRKEIEDVIGSRIERLYAVGGGIQNGLLMQLTADALGCPVLAGPIEGAIIGNVGVQAIATGTVLDLDEWRSIVANSFQPKVYEPRESRYFDENEDAFCRILED